jgi:hypothetical protein
MIHFRIFAEKTGGIMKTKLLLIAFVFVGLVLNAQVNKLSYHFENSLDESFGNGPTLKPLGDPGSFVLDTLNEISGKTKIVYRFAKNNGVQFNNASQFIKKTYTIEIYFVFDELSSWKRVVDWKNRKTDHGAYVYNGELNFYPYVYSGTAPVVAGEYTYYVITRDSTTNEVVLYTDAKQEITFTDNTDDAVTDTANVLNFFFDDLQVTGEASSGAVALINLYNYKLDTVAIKNNFNDLQGKVFGISEKQDKSFSAWPNPANGNLFVHLNSVPSGGTGQLTLYNTAGAAVVSQVVAAGSSPDRTLNVASLPDGIYLLKLQTSSGSDSRKVVIRHND